jgi:hypothetical protein
LEEGLAAGVDQLISHGLSALASTVDNEIRIKVDAFLGPLLAERATMQREFMPTTMENQVSSSLPGATFQDDWLMVGNFFSQHTFSQSSTIGDKIDDALDSSAGGGGGDLLGSQISSYRAALGTLQKEMKDAPGRLVRTCVTIGNLFFRTLEFTTKWTTLELPQDHDAALIYVGVVPLFHSIGT